MSRKVLTLMLCFGVIVFMTGCSLSKGKTETEKTEELKGSAEMEEKAMYHNLDQKAAKARMDSGDELTIVDVRREDEYTGGHIKNALLIPNESIDDTMPDALPDKDAEILVYCRSGNRSRQAAEKLVAMGYTRVYDFGGITTWPYEIVKE